MELDDIDDDTQTQLSGPTYIIVLVNCIGISFGKRLQANINKNLQTWISISKTKVILYQYCYNFGSIYSCISNIVEDKPVMYLTPKTIQINNQ